jgi:HK97 family phage major capsid protein
MSRWLPGVPEIQSRADQILALVNDLTIKERNDLSIVRAINWLSGDRKADGPERDWSTSAAKVLGRETAGMYFPTRVKAAGLDTKTNAAGLYTVATEVRDLIELLRAKARVVQAGATMLSGLVGNLQFPKQATATTGAWVAQNSGVDITDNDSTFAALSMSPKTYMASTSYSRQFLAQSTVDAENFVRNDLATAHALAIDLAALNGTGTLNQPLGVLKTTGIGSVAIGTNGGVPTAGFVTDLETAIATANADAEGMAYLTTPAMRGKLKKIGRLDNVNASLPLWESNPGGVGSMNGYPAFCSSQVPNNLTKGTSIGTCHAIILGYWPSLMIGEWGVLEIIVDIYTKKKVGMIEVCSFQLVDVGIRQPACFAAIQDATLA